MQIQILITSFNTVNGKYYCNIWISQTVHKNIMRFNTVNGKYYCNMIDTLNVSEEALKFQYRKR